ncbi:MAG: thioredoxin family protein [Planctomycetota bacterium]
MSSAFAVAPSKAADSAVMNGGGPQPDGVVWHNNLESGWAESKRRNVPMVIFVSSERCQYCEAMKRTTWCDGAISKRLRDFVAIRLNPKDNAETLGRIHVPMYPTTMIGAPEGRILEHRTGYQPSGAIHSLLSRSWSLRR